MAALSGMTVDGAALRGRWDAACDATVDELGRAQRAAQAAGRTFLAEALGRSIGDVRFLQSAVDARRRPPGSRFASGLVHDLPQDLGEPPYRAAGDALLELRASTTTGWTPTGTGRGASRPAGRPHGASACSAGGSSASADRRRADGQGQPHPRSGA